MELLLLPAWVKKNRSQQPTQSPWQFQWQWKSCWKFSRAKQIWGQKIKPLQLNHYFKQKIMLPDQEKIGNNRLDEYTITA